MRAIKWLKFAGLSILGLLTGYFIFLLYLKVGGGYDEWKRRIKQKYGVGIWDV